MQTEPINNPFTQRSRIVDATRFTGRWRELSMIFDAIDSRRPVLITGGPGIGKSSLLSHIVASAAIHLEEPALAAFYLPLRGDATPELVYQTVLQALGEPGSTATALDVALVARDTPALLCLDDAHLAVQAGWGGALLETLARIARGRQLLLIVAVAGEAPALGERFAVIRLGGFAPAEIRLFAESYLEGTGINFSANEVRALAHLSAGHPAYLQRAAYYLFDSRQHGGDWRARFLAEARARPIPGAPLPPAAFEGEGATEAIQPAYGSGEPGQQHATPQVLPLPEAPRILLLLIAPMAALLFYFTTNNLAGAFLTLVISAAALAAWLRRRPIN